ncbi:MAG: ABC transporter permease [Vicinamibacteraceae bacterium]
MRSILQDLRFGARLLLRAPAFTLVAVASLALGIGANAAIFGAINGLLLKPIDARAPDRLVAIFTSDFSGPRYGASSYADAVDFARGAPALSGVAAATIGAISLTIDATPERAFVEEISPNYFDVLGLAAVAGHLPSAALADGGAAPAVVLTHRYWQRRFGGAPGIVGRSIRIGREATTIVGVAPEGYAGLMRGLDLDAFVVQPFTPERAQARGDRGYTIIGRLASGAGLGVAQAQLAAVAANLHRAHPQEWTDVRGQARLVTVAGERALRIPPDATQPVAAFLAMLALTVGLVLLVACANVAGLLVARAADRQQEIAVRLSLGARRGRLVRQLLVESALLAAIAAAAGLLVAQWLLVILERIHPPLPLPVRLTFSIDGTVLAMTTALAATTAIAFGLAPALQATRGLQRAANVRGGVPDRARRVPLRAVLVVSQVALSVVLLVLAGLFVRSLQQASGGALGFDAEHVLIATVDPSMLDYPDARGAQLYDAIVARVRTVPGVRAASVARVVPLSLDFDGGRRHMRPSQYEPRPGEDMEVPYNAVGPAYFSTLGIRVMRGREFADADRPGAEGVIIVNEAYAARYWPGRDPLAQRVSVAGDDGPWLRVVGLVANTKYSTPNEAPTPILILPFAQHYRPQAKIHVRTAGNPADLAGPVRDAIHAVDPALPILALSTMSERTSVSLLPQRIAGGLIGVFGFVALLLSLLGLYGILARSVAQRSREIGIRLALGAAPGSVMRLVMAQGWRLTAIGLVSGLALAAAAARLLEAFLPAVSPLDTPAFAGAALVLGAGASMAMWLPARRALAVDPAQALRSE